MASVRHMLLSLLAVLGLLSALGWEGTALACPSNPVAAAPMVRMQGCGHAPMPTKPSPANHDGQICSSLCFGVLPPLASLDAHAPLAFVPMVARLQPLSGVGPGLDPPPPRGT